MSETKYPKTYRKAIKGAVGGRLLNSRGQEEEFVLKGDPSKVDPTSITIEIPNLDADKYFLKHNKPAMINGYLIEVGDGLEMSLDENNAVSDGYLMDLLKQPFAKMKSRALQFTSPVPVNRLLTFALKDNKPYKTIEFLKATLASMNSNAPKVAEIDSVKVGGTG
jgi:hypothetical protein